MVLNLDQIPPKARAYMALSIALASVKAGVDIMFQTFDVNPWLNEHLPPEWPFKWSLDEMSAECDVCMQKYRDAAITEIAQGILDQIVQLQPKEEHGDG